MKNLGLIGGFLMVIFFGFGSISFDEKSIDFN